MGLKRVCSPFVNTARNRRSACTLAVWCLRFCMSVFLCACMCACLSRCMCANLNFNPTRLANGRTAKSECLVIIGLENCKDWLLQTQNMVSTGCWSNVQVTVPKSYDFGPRAANNFSNSALALASLASFFFVDDVPGATESKTESWTPSS